MSLKLGTFERDFHLAVVSKKNAGRFSLVAIEKLPLYRARALHAY